jgi:RNA polymerase sigma factor (sigma-70 family)
MFGQGEKSPVQMLLELYWRRAENGQVILSEGELADLEARERELEESSSSVDEKMDPIELMGSETPEERWRRETLGNSEVDEVEPPENAATHEMLKHKIEQVLGTLTFRERELIKLRYGVGDGYTYTLAEVGRIFKITHERVQQIEAKAVRKLQHPVRARKLDGFLDSFGTDEGPRGES